MDHNLDSLNLESAMGVDFESPDNVEVSQADLSLPSNPDEAIPMEFEHIEEQPMMLDTGSEEIIDFMGDQFTLQEYSVQDNQTTGLTTTAESNQNVLTSQAETMLDLQLKPQNTFVTEGPKIISVKAAIPSRPTTTKKETAIAPLPRTVAIAPKPPKLSKPFTSAKPLSIAPKPVAVVKRVSIGNVIQANSKGNTVLAQIGKKANWQVMMPAGAQKLKLVTAASGTPVQYIRASNDQASLIPNKDEKPVMMAKVILPGQSNSNQSAVLTKILPATGTKNIQPRFVTVQPKTVPITIGNKQVIMASPTKQGGKTNKKQQIISIKSPPKLVPVTSAAALAKKVVIAANTNQNVVLKATAPPKTAQIGKDGSVVIDGQQTQLHQINVPGKGIQYIRLVTNPNASVLKPKASGSLLSMPSKFVLTDTKAGGKKLVRIAPVTPKATTTSLLAPLSPVGDSSQDLTELLAAEERLDHTPEPTEEIDSKAALQSLIESSRTEEHDMDLSFPDIKIECKKPSSPERRESAELQGAPEPEPPQSVIVINEIIEHDDESTEDKIMRIINREADVIPNYQSPPTPQPPSETGPELVVTDLGLRPRKACNCTKSQCLKLYCDCFANGEFCNRCNCTNCYNNLEHEELRQKAIRGCLDRNPNAFRPKIGKAKAGGPEIVRRHNKGCNCKRSGCLKNYCECYEAKIACTSMCRCVGCRNVEESLEQFRRAELPARRAPPPHPPPHAHPAPRTPLAAHAAANPSAHPVALVPTGPVKQPCSFMTNEVIEAVCQCLLAAAGEGEGEGEAGEREAGERGRARGEGAAEEREPLRDVIEEFARCLQDIIGAAHQPPAAALLDQGAT